MDISVNCKNDIDTNKINRIKNISETAIKLYEEILERPYGEIPKIVILDKEGYTRKEMDSFVQDKSIFQDENILNKFLPDTPYKVIDAYEEGMYKSLKDLIHAHYHTWSALYQSDDHTIYLKEELLKEPFFPQSLSHELFHGEKKCRTANTTTYYLCDADKALHSLVEGMADYMAMEISDKLLYKELISSEENNYKEKYIQNLKAFYPIGSEEKYMDTYAIYSLGYFYVEKKINEGLPIKKITSLLQNIPKNIKDLYRDDIVKRKNLQKKNLTKTISFMEIVGSKLTNMKK